MQNVSYFFILYSTSYIYFICYEFHILGIIFYSISNTWFFTKIVITQPRMIQIPKFWCLKSCTNIWLHFGNIHSIQKINRIELEGKKGSKFAKIGQFFTLQNIKIEITQIGLHEVIISQLFLKSTVHDGFNHV